MFKCKLILFYTDISSEEINYLPQFLKVNSYSFEVYEIVWLKIVLGIRIGKINV